jgi:hypothetical protein
VIACIALVAALGGTAVARIIISSGSQVANGVLTGADIKNGSIGKSDLSSSALSATGPAAYEGFSPGGPAGVNAEERRTVVTVEVPAGIYAVFAQSNIVAPGSRANALSSSIFGSNGTVTAQCELNAGGEIVIGQHGLGGPNFSSPASVTAQVTKNVGSTTTFSYACFADTAKWDAGQSSIIAIRLGSATRRISQQL